MTLWDWTWEDRSQANRTPTVEPDPASDEHDIASAAGEDPGGAVTASRVFRRRRASAVAGLIVVVAVLIAAIGSHKSSSHPRISSKRRPLTTLSPSQADRAADQAKAERRAIDAVLAYTPFVRS